MTETSLQLDFAGIDSLELVQTTFRLGSTTHASIRGKTSGAYHDFGSFQWTSAVKALAVVALKGLLSAQTSDPQQAILSGGRASLAASLDYALAKSPRWLVEMFGCYRDGRLYARRLINITNSHRKRQGLVAVSLNTRLLLPDQIRITLNGCAVTSASALEHLLTHIDSTGSAPSFRCSVLPSETSIRQQKIEEPLSILASCEG
jgi:hypothetical protein